MTLVQTTTEKIKTKGFWTVTIRPADFQETRVADRSKLFQIVHDAAVSINGRSIPAIDLSGEPVRHGPDWIELSTDWDADIQSWRFYQSGQFVLLLANWTEWNDRRALRQIPLPTGQKFPFWDSLGTFVAIYEFAARLASTPAGGANMVVRTTIKNLQGAQLVQDNLRKTSLRHYIFREDIYQFPAGKSVSISREALMGNPRQFAAEAGNDLLHRFGFQSTVESVMQVQSEFQ